MGKFQSELDEVMQSMPRSERVLLILTVMRRMKKTKQEEVVLSGRC